MLTKEGRKVSLKRVQRLMKAAGIYSIVRKKYRPHSNKDKVEDHDNLEPGLFNDDHQREVGYGYYVYPYSKRRLVQPETDS
ncbi:hypothetical protein BpJC4_31360 [Weizmannia acidilactici]|nr:hypothetical protein BpJC4_31360 [Weizmannia acidilactici]